MMVQLLDGALGTELERRGVATTTPGWSSQANQTHPELVRTIHEEYIRAGAEIIRTNTFRTNPRAHKDSKSTAHDLTMRAVLLAQEARESTGASVQIAGSVAPVEDCFSPQLAPLNEDELVSEHAQFIAWLVGAGVDIIMIETMSTLREAKAALRAAKETSRLPIFVSVVLHDAETLLDGTLLSQAVRELSSADLLAINCTPLTVISDAREAFASQCSKVGVRFGSIPNASERDTSGRWDLHASSDDAIAKEATRWIEIGASVVGSCCGTTPMTTGVIAAAIRRSSERQEVLCD